MTGISWQESLDKCSRLCILIRFKGIQPLFRTLLFDHIASFCHGYDPDRCRRIRGTEEPPQASDAVAKTPIAAQSALLTVKPIS